ncbi:HAD-IIIC family phosphatase [Butyrivibrio sp. XPD2002]|uniref:HAD-IIIC family phosphatase n=1 Tax=Butyrivibrio sp. XPD2002 TaxID=1280665 RepID=UPI000420CA79|nr:HAD-IIIC family phosphatase [Butyrivibrio sp. XPD2002]
MRELEYPFKAEEIIKKKKSYKKQLLSESTTSFIEKKIAILGGQTTQDIKLVLELFLLNYGIKPSFYESEFNQWFEDGMFSNSDLESFAPDLIYVCTCIRNITDFPQFSDDKEAVELKRKEVVDKFRGLWASLSQRYNCPIIQNNFEYPFFRLMGNMDASDYHGRVNYITRINCDLYDYAQSHGNFYICDVNYISSAYGLDRWSDPYYWHMYKYAVSVPAIPYLSFNVANIIKSIYGKNKKVFNLDLDNTLWGGIIGDDGADNIEIGQETALAQTYSEFQEYIKLHKQMGILLTVNSKNDNDMAVSGFNRPDSILKMDDFVSFKANWNPKSVNLAETAQEISLLPESFVFVDDNPAERAIIDGEMPFVSVPEIESVEHYIQVLDKSGFFETTSLSNDDLRRSKMYQENVKRQQYQSKYANYEDYLKSLEMKGEIHSFDPLYMSRIAQLTNKSNQFNLTTKRYSQSEIEEVAEDSNYITLYGKLEDKFGDNGVVSIVIGRIKGENKDELHMELWLMSCRVLKRDMEYAMMDELVDKAKSLGIRTIFGYYYPTAKNSMVKDFYSLQGFEKISEDVQGNTIWKYIIHDIYQKKQNVIKVNLKN